MGLGIGGHHRPYEGASDVWLTPPELLKALGEFDLDPCAAPEPRPWPTAKKMVSLSEDGLAVDWPMESSLFINPPYGPETAKWLEKLSCHGNGIALTFARTETIMFFKWVWGKATAILFIEGRLYFYNKLGKRAAANSGGPSCLIAYGTGGLTRLKSSGIKGALVSNWRKQ